MDIIWIFLAIAFLYGLPELLRKKNKKVNEYPKFPQQPVPVSEPTVPDRRMKQFSVETSHDADAPSEYVQMSAAAPTVGFSEKPRFDSNQVITGIVWTEILAKPKQVKPYLPLSKR